MKVSVVMASMNPNKVLLADAIRSVLNQTFSDFELIVVDDGSKEPIEPEIKEISSGFRVKVYRIPNSGLGAALNYGIAHSEGEYIARIDDDDLMCPTRLEKQVTYLDEHPEVSCLGTQHFDKVGNRYRKHKLYPVDHEQMVRGMLTDRRLPMAHTALMFRRTSFDEIGGYRIPGGGQDADLMLQMSRVGKLANLSEYLTYYTMTTAGLGTINPNKRKAYLFAYEEILNQNVYTQYEPQIKNSINILKNQIAAGQKSVRKTKIIRKLLTLRIKLLGKNFNL